MERPQAFVKPVPQSGITCRLLEISISIINGLRSCMVSALSARIGARGGGRRMHVVGDRLGKGRGVGDVLQVTPHAISHNEVL